MKVFFEETTNQNEKKNFSSKKSLIVLKSTVKPQIFIEHDERVYSTGCAISFASF